MITYKMSEIADVQSGLVLSRKAAKDSKGLYKYKRLTLRSVTDENFFDTSSFEDFEACEQIDKQFLTQENDIIVRLFAPPCTALIDKKNEGLIVPSQLAIVRLKNDNVFLPGYINAYLSNGCGLISLIESVGMMSQKIIKVGNISDVEIPYIPLEKQHIISDMAKCQSNIIASYKKIIEQESLRTRTVINDMIGGKI